MRVAIASSGLGHVARGIETWAADTARALAEGEGRGARKEGRGTGDEGRGVRGEGRDNGHGEPLEVTLFAGAPLEGGVRKRGEVRGARDEVRGARDEGGDRAPALDPALTARGYRLPSTVVLPCLRRGGWTARFLARWSPGFAWRWGLKNPYGWEQLSFWLRLWPQLARGRFDILHVQDPMLADWCRRFRRLRLVSTREILAHGTEEPIEFLARFDYVQHLAPWHLSESEKEIRRKGFEQKVAEDTKGRKTQPKTAAFEV